MTSFAFYKLFIIVKLSNETLKVRKLIAVVNLEQCLLRIITAFDSVQEVSLLLSYFLAA